MPVRDYKYSYSGADARVFTWFPQAPNLINPLSSVHTVSVSVHEAKGQARALGHRGIKGLARGVRTIAGSLILTVINDHPLRELFDQYNQAFIEGNLGEPSLGWSIDRRRVGVGTLFNNYAYNNRLATLIPPFNLAVQYVTETGPIPDQFAGERPEGAGCMIVGMEFLDEAQVTSVNDIVTEMTFSFIACDFKPLAAYDIGANTLLELSSTQDEFARMEDDLFRDLFFEDVGVSGPDNQSLSELDRSIAKALGIDNVDEQRLQRALDTAGD